MVNSNKKTRYSKFQAKIFRILILVGIFPLVLISSVSLITVVSTRAKNVSELQLQTIEATSEKIKGYLEEKADVFNLIIDLDVTDISKVKKESLSSLIDQMKQEIEGIHEISFINMSGQEVVKRSEIQESAFLVLKDASAQLDFIEAMSGKDYFGQIDFTPSGPVMRIASQIKNKDRQIIGVISVEIDLGPIETIVSGTGLGQEGFVYLIDQNGNLINSSNKDFARFGQNLSYIPLIGDVLKGNMHDGLLKEDKYFNSLDQKVIFSGKEIGITGWALMSEWPERDAFLVINDMLNQALLIILASLALIIIFSFFIARAVVKPIALLKKGVAEIGKGNLGFRIKINTRDEIEELGDGFNKMALDLKEVQRVKELEIRSKALAKALEKEKKLSQEKDIFIQTISHQLRTPISVLNWTLEFLRKKKASPKKAGKKLLSSAHQSVKELTAIVNDFVAASDFATTSYTKKDFKVIDIAKTVADLIDDLDVEAKEKKVKVSFKKSGTSFKILAVSAAIGQVIKNLIENAICYTKQGGRADILLKSVNNKVIFEIKDSGIGIPQKEQNLIFSQFFRASNSVEEKNVGTGLGLYIVKKIIQAHKGKVSFQSEQGKGSTFSFSLPLVKS